MNRYEAVKATKNGAVAGYILGALSLLISLTSVYRNPGGAIGLAAGLSVAFYLGFIFTCAYGISKKSRLAAVLLFVYLIFRVISKGMEPGKASGIRIGILVPFIYFYGKAIQGAFVFHKIEKSENPDYKTTPKWILITGVSVLIIVAALIGIGTMIENGVLPSPEVQIGTEISQKNRDMLISNSIIIKDDHIEYFYSMGLTSILQGGSILTEDRVILYFMNEYREIEVYEIYVNDISSIELVEMGNFMNDSIYMINSNKLDAWLPIPLSTQNGGGVKFIEALRAKINIISL